MSTTPVNMREKTAAIAEWLGYHHEDIAYGLRSVADAEKLYDYWQAHGDLLPEFCDEEPDDPDVDVTQHCINAIGYDPLVIVPVDQTQPKVNTAVNKARVALREAEKLLDSVAFVREDGDTEHPLRLIRGALSSMPAVTDHE